MSELQRVVASRGGAAKTVELLQAGFSARQLARAVGTGILLRPRKAWYVLPSTRPALIRAVRVGGRVTCVTALEELGAWVTEHDDRSHVAVHRSACELRSARDRRARQTVSRDAVVHWVDTPSPRRVAGSRLIEQPRRILADLVVCLREEALVASVESMLHRRLLSAEEWQEALAGMSAARRAQLAIASELSGSGLETYFVTRIRRLGIVVVQQVWVGRDRVDALIGECLVVELNGRAFHDPHADHLRAARLILNGMRVLVFDYHQVMSDWQTVEAVVLTAVRRGDHLR